MSLHVAQAWIEYVSRSPDFIALLKEDGELFWINRGLPGYKKEDLVGKNVFELFDQQYWDTLRHCMESAINDGKTYIFESFFPNPVQGDLWYQQRIMCLFSSKEETPLISWTSIDISEDKAKSRKIEDFSKRLQFSNERLRNFANLISHDLRTPLRLIYSYLDLLGNSGALLDFQWDFLRKAQEASSLMDRMILALLDYSQLDREEEEEKFSLTLLVEEVLEDLQKDYQGFTHKVFRLPRCIVAQKERISRVLKELFLNAIYHVGPDVHIDIFSVDERHYWHICIGDNGAGVPKGKWEVILRPFSGLRQEEEGKGLGMGLAICDKIIQGHGGLFWMEERDHESGLLVHFTIPKRTIVDEIQNDYTVEVSGSGSYG